MVEHPAPVARLLDELGALDRAYSPGHHGRWSGSRRAGIVRGCLRELFREQAPPPGIALVALGGFGRGELAPRSDVDLLILHTGERASEVTRLAESLLYPLWDAGLSVGHAVRTPPECLALVAEHLDAATAMLDGIAVAGDGEVLEGVRSELLGRLRADPRAFVRRLKADAADRRDRFGVVSALLEPELKEGAGGLRDIQMLGWLAEAVCHASGGGPTGSPTSARLASLARAGLLRQAERERVEEAAEFLTRVRSALHLETGRPVNRLHLEQQPAIADAMGFEDEPGLPAVDGLMRAVFAHARQVEQVVGAVFDRSLQGSSDAVLVEPTAEGVLAAFADVARRRGVMSTATLDRIEQVEVPPRVVWTDGMRESFLQILRAGEEGARALEALDRIELLDRLLPEWGPVRCRPQRDPYHRHTVDVHLLRTLSGVARLLAGEDGGDPLAAEAASLVRDPDALLLGALLHDIGKTGGGSHVPVGAEVARLVLERIGVPAPTRDLAVFLVAEHLLLSDTATRRDLGDDDLILDVAARVGEPERLAALYLLTLADAAATGPLAWTPWRATLVRELVAKVQRVLERGEMGVETAERLAERAEELRLRLANEDPAEVDRFLLRMPRSYFLTLPVERIAAHFALLRTPVGAAEVRTQSGPGSRAGAHELTVVAADRPGLLSWIAGALSLAGLSILTAQVFTTEDGTALDVFEVEGLFEPEIDEERWRRFRAALRKAIEGRISLEHQVLDKRRHYRSPRAEVPVRVSVHNDVSDFFTVVEVGAPDRIGLLFDVTRTFADLHLDVHLAKVATYGARVVDVFYVRDELGRKVEGAEQIAEVERALRERLDERPLPEVSAMSVGVRAPRAGGRPSEGSGPRPRA